MFVYLYNLSTHVIIFKDWVPMLLDMWRSEHIYTERIEVYIRNDERVVNCMV